MIDHIQGMQLNLNWEMDDRPVWTPEQDGNFTVSSAWNIMRQKKTRNWFDAKLGIKKILSR